MEAEKKALRGQNVKMYQRFSMLFSCLLSFGFIFVMFLLFNLIQILICHVFLFIRFFFSSFASSSFPTHTHTISFSLSRCPCLYRPIVNLLRTIHDHVYSHKISLKNINIRLKRLTLCFVPSVHLTRMNGCLYAVVRSLHAIVLYLV